MYEEARESGGPGSQEGGGASGRGGEGVRGTILELVSIIL